MMDIRGGRGWGGAWQHRLRSELNKNNNKGGRTGDLVLRSPPLRRTKSETLLDTHLLDRIHHCFFYLRNELPEAKILSNNAFETLISFRKTLVECMKITKISACGTRDLYNITEFSLLQKRDNRRKCNSPIHDNHKVIAFEIRIDKL